MRVRGCFSLLCFYNVIHRLDYRKGKLRNGDFTRNGKVLPTERGNAYVH
jgi:hypothetical protein